jgi:hypothetical protein
MPFKYWFIIPLLVLPTVQIAASPAPLEGTENIPQLMAESIVVCKGKVVDAPEPVYSWNHTAGMTATAQIRAARCFKGAHNGRSIPVLFDRSVTGPHFFFRKGDYRLFFLKSQDDKYTVVDEFFGALPISHELGATPKGADDMQLLELDLEAGLQDSDPELRLASIRMLGNMKHLHSLKKLKAMLKIPDLLVRTYVWQALLRLKDYSVLPAVAEFFDMQPEAPRELFLPRDRLFNMQIELERTIGDIRDSSTLPYLERFAVGKGSHLRDRALQALRNIQSLHSAPIYLKELDDPNADNAFSAMQGLLELAGSNIAWAPPSWEKFRETPQLYATKCREWWKAEGQKKRSLTRPTLHTTHR